MSASEWFAWVVIVASGVLLISVAFCGINLMLDYYDADTFIGRVARFISGVVLASVSIGTVFWVLVGGAA